MIQLQSQEYFTIVRGIEDHTDSNTYYVRAVVRNARTDVLLSTVDLTDQGSRRFSKEWQVPADVSGQGFYIVITTTVYTDSGYTTKSALYGETFTDYLVQERFNPILGGRGGGKGVDYEKLRKIIKEEVDKSVQPINIEKPDLSALNERIKEVKTIIANIRIPEPEKLDLTSVHSAISGVLQAVSAIRIPEPEKLDLTPVLKELQRSSLEKSADKIKEMQESIKQFYLSDMKEFKSSVSKIMERLEAIPTILIPENIKKEEKPKRSRNFNL